LEGEVSSNEGELVMEERRLAILKISLSLTLVAVLTINAAAAATPRITKEELKSILDNPDVVVLDLRIGRDWKASEYKIKGAIWVDHSRVNSFAKRYDKDKTLVLY
jgi:hypothetical protein